MVEYRCEKCDKNFDQKSHYDAHLNKKNPCVCITKPPNEFIASKVKNVIESNNKKVKKISKKTISKKKLLRSETESDTNSNSSDSYEEKDDKKDDKKKRVQNVSPLRYPGGKTRACEKIYNVILKFFDVESISELISPFFGGGSFEFYIQNKLKIPIIANDKFKPLYTFWSCVKNEKELLIKEIKKNKNITRENFKEFRKDIMDLKNGLKQSAYYFIINRCSFSGATLSGGFSEEASKKRFTDSSIDRINKLNLSSFLIHNEDFSDFLNRKFDKDRLIFLDPPYYLEKESKLYGNNGDMHENFDHGELYKIISKKNKWIMTYNDCEYIRNLYKQFEIINVDWAYGMNKTKKSSEIIIVCK